MAPQTLKTTRDVYNPLTQDARGGGNIASADAHHHEGNVDLVKWMVMIVLIAGIALGLSIVLFVQTRGELDRQYRQIQEYRIRVEDAENAVVQVNPNFHPKR